MKIGLQLDDVFENNIGTQNTTKRSFQNEDLGKKNQKLKVQSKLLLVLKVSLSKSIRIL